MIDIMGDLRHAAYSVRSLHDVYIDKESFQRYRYFFRDLPEEVLLTGTWWVKKDISTYYSPREAFFCGFPKHAGRHYRNRHAALNLCGQNICVKNLSDLVWEFIASKWDTFHDVYGDVPGWKYVFGALGVQQRWQRTNFYDNFEAYRAGTVRMEQSYNEFQEDGHPKRDALTRVFQIINDASGHPRMFTSLFTEESDKPWALREAELHREFMLWCVRCIIKEEDPWI